MLSFFKYNFCCLTLLNREACKSILNFLSDIFDLSNSSEGKYRELINAIVLQRGATLTRIMIAALTGALPSGRLEEVCLLFMPDMVFFLLMYHLYSKDVNQHFSILLENLIVIYAKREH
jgi:hypothetical protein